MNDNKTESLRLPHPLIALLPIAILIAMLFATIGTFGSDALSGGSQIALLTTTAVCVAIGILFYGRTWKDYINAISKNIGNTSEAIIILLIIGSLSGTWMVSGVVPTLISYGMEVLSPRFFLASTCLICAAVSLMTGSSWTTIATIGIALMGIGRALGYDDGWIAGAIISGAYFGDKVSPLSDTTVLASSTPGVPLFEHIRYMLVTTIPSLLLATLIFFIAGLTYDIAPQSQTTDFIGALHSRFTISPWLLLVPLFTAVLIARKVPSIITLFLSTLMAAVFAMLFQPDLLREIAAASGSGSTSLFTGAMISVYGSTSLQCQNAILEQLVATRGMAGMLFTVWLILCAMCFGGAMTAGGMLRSITRLFAHFMRNTVSVVASTVGSGLFLNLATADQYISIIMTGQMFSTTYDKLGYERRLLSRTTEDAVTVTSPLIPWNTCGMTQATVLSVATLTYLPYCFFNLISPLMSIFMAAIGYKIVRRKPADTAAEVTAEQQTE